MENQQTRVTAAESLCAESQSGSRSGICLHPDKNASLWKIATWKKLSLSAASPETPAPVYFYVDLSQLGKSLIQLYGSASKE